jgi:hypothetical protein
MLQIPNKRKYLELKYLGFTKIGKMDKLTFDKLKEATNSLIAETKNKFFLKLHFLNFSFFLL